MPIPIIYPFFKISNEIYRPLVPINVIHSKDNAKQIIVWALLDTGADDCVLPKFIPETLGYDLKSGVYNNTQGIGESSVEMWKHDFKIHLLSPDRSKVVWKSKISSIGCVAHDNAHPLLGWMNFLSNFNIRFNYPTKKILIELSS